MVSNDSDELHLSVSGVPIFDADGGFQGYRGSTADVTDQVRAEQDVAKTRARLSEAIEAIKEGFLLYDREDRIVLVNENSIKGMPKVADLLKPGSTWEEIVQAHLDRGVVDVPPAQRAAWLEAQGEIHRRGGIRHYQSADGRWLELRDHRTADGGCVTLRADITELREAQEALETSEQRFKDFAESSSDWFWEMGPDLRFTWFSVQSQVIGKTRVEASGSDTDSEEWRDHLADLEARRPFKNFRYRLASSDGDEVHVSVSGVPISGADGTFLGYRGTTTDITAQVLAEREVAEGRALLEDAIESVTDGFAMYDRQDRLVLCNEGYRIGIASVWGDLEPRFRWPDFFRAMVDRGLVKTPADDLDAWIEEQSEAHRAGPSMREIETADARIIEIRSYPTRGGGFASVRRDVTALKQGEQALAASEQRFRDFAASSSDWFWEMGPDLRFTWFSDQRLKGTGTETRTALGRTSFEVVATDIDSQHWQDHLADLEAHRPFKDFRYRKRTKDGADTFVSASGIPIFDDDGTFQGYRGTLTSITAQVLAEREVAKARAMLDDAVESVVDGFAMFDRDDRLLLANQGYRSRLTSISHQLGDHFTWPSMIRAMADRGLVRIPSEDRESWIREQTEAHHAGPWVRQVETSDGNFVELRSYPTRDGGFASVRHDITSLKRAEQALKESEQRFKDFADASSDWFWEMGPDLRYVWFSEDTIVATGTHASDLIGKSRRETSKLDGDDPIWREHLADLEARRPFRDFRYLARSTTGADVYVSASGVPLFDAEGAFKGYRGTATNVTAQVRAEREAARAHELLADAIETIDDGFMLFDADDRILMLNESSRRSLHEVADVLGPGRTWDDVVETQLDRGTIKLPAGQRKNAWLAEQRNAHRRGGGVRSYETTDGRWLQVRDRRTRDGGCVAIRADVTEIKRAEQALRESEQRFKNFAEASSDWFWETGPDHRFTWFSTEDPGGTGITASNLIGHTRWMRAVTDDDKRRRRAHLVDLKAHRPFKDFRYAVTNVEGGAAHLSVSGVPIFDADNRFLGYRGTGKNITAEVVAEQRAAAAQAMLSDAIESIREGFALFDKDDRLVLCNENFRQSVSKMADVLKPGMPWKTGFLAQVERRVVKVPIPDREAWISEQIKLHRKPGSVRVMETPEGRWKDVREYPTRDGGLVVIGADITALKQAETALRESETLLKHAAQIADLGHWVWDAQTYRYLHCSDGLARMYDTTPDAYIARQGTQRSMDTVLTGDKERYDDVIGRATRLKKGYDIEFRERQADGSIRHLRERGEPVLDATGTLVRMVGILQDITKHKRAEEVLQRAQHELEMRVDERTAALRSANQALRREIVERERTEDALRESRALLETIVETAAMGINVKDPSLRYLFMNAYQASVYGVTPEQAVGKTPGELIGPDYGVYIEELDLRVLQSGKPLPYFEEEIRDKDGVLRTWLTTKMPVKVGQNILRYIVSTSLDITDLKARERDLKQAQKMDAVGKLTGGIAHDFNNLLFVIRGNAALLKDEIRDSGSARECLGAIQDAARLGADLTRSLLAFSRQQPLEPAIVNLPEVIAHTTATLLRPFEKSIDIQTLCPKAVWPVLVDRHQMENALLNLALNARDAMPNGGTLRISVTNHRSTKPNNGHDQGLAAGDYVCLAVADSGIGMLPEVIEHAFEPFFSTKTAGSGTGLGLSMVYGFIKQSGGYIDIESKLGQGTTITMRLPRAFGTERKLVEVTDQRRWVAQGTETILVTEDDAAVRRVAVRILARFGYRTLEASNSPEALEILESDAAIDLLFADIILSGEMNGAQLSVEARKLRPDLKVLFASGYSEPAVLRDTEGAARAPLLSKPYDAEELGKLVRSLLNGDQKDKKR